MGFPLRTGRKVGRTIYVQVGREPSDGDRLVGMADTPEIAADLVHAYNEWIRLGRLGQHQHRWDTRSSFGESHDFCACGTVRDTPGQQ